jgi:hypothetical protein
LSSSSSPVSRNGAVARPPPHTTIRTTYLLIQEKTTGVTATATTTQGYELAPSDVDRPDEDEVEVSFPTARRHFLFVRTPPQPTTDTTTTTTTTATTRTTDEHTNNTMVPVTVRTTSFGCGKHGSQVWPASLALALHLVAAASCPSGNQIQGQRILELGAGCGLPSMVARDLGAAAVRATDFWATGDDFGAADGNRLIPHAYHGVNLDYNVVGQQQSGSSQTASTATTASVQRLDWHTPESIAAARAFGADWIVGSDLIYYPSDVAPLWETLLVLMEGASGAGKVSIFAPLPPVVRHGLADFQKRLEEQATGAGSEAYYVELNEMTMYRGKIGTEGEGFLEMCISKHPFS